MEIKAPACVLGVYVVYNFSQQKYSTIFFVHPSLSLPDVDVSVDVSVAHRVAPCGTVWHCAARCDTV